MTLYLLYQKRKQKTQYIRKEVYEVIVKTINLGFTGEQLISEHLSPQYHDRAPFKNLI